MRYNALGGIRDSNQPTLCEHGHNHSYDTQHHSKNALHRGPRGECNKRHCTKFIRNCDITFIHVSRKHCRSHKG
ncbi:hypothetical protein NDU88_001264 [Pleurodeles waltl]|uniref:C2H2-type domain-containing protein n=1 Tax=Pleurodeles waltl TaxID=8319 RepID=A0AAV7Q9A3_PLEWA|nr:hypothetical protein NDU88_001264 [Pleurodeles waltl]